MARIGKAVKPKKMQLEVENLHTPSYFFLKLSSWPDSGLRWADSCPQALYLTPLL